MSKRLSVGLVIIAVLLFVLSGCTRNIGTEAQAQARTQSEQASPDSRVIATTVAAAQIMDALEINLVGVPKSYKQLPKRYEGVAEVGNPMSPNMEVIKSLDPTDVLSVTTLQYDLAPVFSNAGVQADYLDLTSVEKMNRAIQALGDKYGRQKQAEAIISRFDEKLAVIKKKAEGKPAPRVLILLGVPGSYLVATEHSYIGDLVKLAGGINVIQGEKVEYLASNTEYLQQSNPDVILRAAHGMPEEVIIMFDKEFKKNDIWKHFDAVKNNRVYDLEEERFGTTGNLAAVEALDILVHMLYP
ncbi:heme ABC transporter substrate-binding protein IsdE [Paenibacillus piri]|uniref:High-affinity heme uptake system protein IsdE n=2 Tax=Paenibacillus piri TaxID=2547395 RepID=A0A4R5KB54_9BACL|nr:heme ABC transporter substrate-binding protein IsdE [Paenibacillus piri]